MREKRKREKQKHPANREKRGGAVGENLLQRGEQLKKEEKRGVEQQGAGETTGGGTALPPRLLFGVAKEGMGPGKKGLF